MTGLKLIKRLFVLLTLNALSGCDAKNDVATSPYPVIDTGFWNAEVTILSEPLWLDNDRILFSSTENLKADGHGPIRLKVFDTRTGQVVSTRFSAALCVRGGVAVLAEKPNESTWENTAYFRGTPENYQPESPHPDDTQLDINFECDWVPKATSAQLGFYQFPAKAKLRGENYIELLEAGKPFYHADASALGVSLSNMSVKYLLWKYSEFLDAYVASGHYDPKSPNASSFAILHRNGKLETIPYPKAMLPGNNDIYPVKNGFLVHYADGPITETNHGKRGLYLMQGEQVQHLIIGTFGHVVVSPDGCKAAIAHAYSIQENLFKPISKRTIKFINVCQGDSKP